MLHTAEKAPLANATLNEALLLQNRQNNTAKPAKKIPYTPPTTSKNLSRFLEASCDCC